MRASLLIKIGYVTVVNMELIAHANLMCCLAMRRVRVLHDILFLGLVITHIFLTVLFLSYK